MPKLTQVSDFCIKLSSYLNLIITQDIVIQYPVLLNKNVEISRFKSIQIVNIVIFSILSIEDEES